MMISNFFFFIIGRLKQNKKWPYPICKLCSSASKDNIPCPYHSAQPKNYDNSDETFEDRSVVTIVRPFFNDPTASFGSSHRQLKSCDFGPASFPLVDSYTTDVGTTLINAIQQGTSIWERVGRTCYMQKLYIRGLFTPTGTANFISDYVHWAVVYDAQSDGQTPLWSDVFGTYDQDGTFDATQYSFPNPNNTDRFKILLRKSFPLPPVDQTAITFPPSTCVDAEPSWRNVEECIDLNNLVVQFNGTANPTTISQITTGALFIVSVGSFLTGSQGWQMIAQIRLTFYDD